MASNVGGNRCKRCNGRGGWEGWPGFTCFACNGRGYELPEDEAPADKRRMCKQCGTRHKASEEHWNGLYSKECPSCGLWHQQKNCPKCGALHPQRQAI